MEVKIIKSFRLGKRVTNKHRPLLICFNSDEPKHNILSKSYLLRSTKPYEDIYVSVDKTKAEQAKHKVLVEELKSRRAKGETNIVIRGNNIITKSASRVKPIQPVAAPATMATDDQSG